MDRSVRKALTRPRHLMVTLAVALATGAIGVAAAGVSGDNAVQADSAWDLPFMVPAIHEGDHGRYVHAGGHDGRDDGYWPDFVDFAWIGKGSVYNATGATVLVNQLAYHEGRPGSKAEILDVLPGGTSQIIGSWDSNQTYVDSRDGLWPGGNDTSVDQIHYVSFLTNERPLSVWCGILNPLQGKAVHLADSVQDPTRCWNGPGSWNADGYTVVATKVAGPDGGRVAVFEGRYAQHGLIASPAFLRAYYREGVAYPVRLEYVSGPVGGDCSCAAVYVLEGLTVGTSPLPAESEVLAPPPQAAILAPRTETGPDASGVHHPFPLAEAWAHARDDKTYTDLADYRAAHPGSYMGQAMYEVHTQDARVIQRWYIVLTDGTDQFAFLVERTDPTTPHLPPPLVSPPAQPVAAPSYRYDRLTNGWEEGPYPPASAIPAAMPTVASMMQAWTTFSGSTEPPNSWAFDLRSNCHGNCSVGATYSGGAAATYSVGVKHDDFAGVATVASYRAIWQDELEFNAEGRASGAFMRDTKMTTSVDALPDPAPTPESSDHDAAVDALATAPTRGDWSISPREVAAAGGLAFLTAAAYFLWPALKAGPLALFSRVRTDKLLDNAVRAELHQAIEARAGIHQQDLVRLVGKGNGTVEHHLRKLLDAGLVTRVQGKGYTCYFLKGSTDRHTMAAAPVLKSPVAQAVLEAARSRPGVPPSVLARELGVAPPTISYHLRRLESAGLVTMQDGVRAVAA